ncbi:MAG TPA: GAF domain-containing sensor histidine kinase [Anaeromyxobacteraceae bacterium]
MGDGEASGLAGRARRLLLGQAGSSSARRYGLALVLALAAVLASQLFRGELQAYRVLLSFGAVLVAALRGGAGPGFLALAICAAVERSESGSSEVSRWLEEPDPIHRLAFFAGFGALGVWGASAVREAYLHTQARRHRAEARADEQRIAAELGVRALAESDLDTLLGETLSAVKQALRCDAVTLLELQPNGDSLRLRQGAGVEPTLLGKDFGPCEAPLAFRALTTRQPVAVDDLAAEPASASGVLRQHGVVSSAVAPVVASGPGGRPFGVLGAHARTRRPFTADEVSFLQSAANVVGTAVVRLRSEERVRRTLAAERFLAEASGQLALSIDWQQTLSRVVRLAVPFLGDWALVVVVGPDGEARSVAAEAADPALGAVARELLERYPIERSATHGVGRVLRTGAPELITEIAPDTFVDGDAGEGGDLRRDILRRLGLRSYIAAPLAVGQRILGAVAFGLGEGPRRYGPDDLALAEALAQRCALAIENASLYRAAQEATRVREEVLAIVSHDLKTPLGALHMGAQVVARLAPSGAQGEELRRAANTVRRTAERMGRLIHDLVDVASMEAGRLSLSRARHDAATIAREVVEALSPLAVERAVELTFDADEPLPLGADRDRLHQVLTNLISNALQVTPAGGKVKVASRREGSEVVFSVSDTGPGIPAEDLAHLFERWYRGRRAPYPGSGLGLAIARAIVEGHGGRIWVESEEGAGSAFSFAIPIQPSSAAGLSG